MTAEALGAIRITSPTQTVEAWLARLHTGHDSDACEWVSRGRGSPPSIRLCHCSTNLVLVETKVESQGNWMPFSTSREHQHVPVVVGHALDLSGPLFPLIWLTRLAVTVTLRY